MNIIYNIEDESTLFDDFKHLKLALDLLKYDYLGGHGSRGYGRVDVEDISVRLVAGSRKLLPLMIFSYMVVRPSTSSDLTVRNSFRV